MNERNDNWISLEEAAQYMGVTKETIRNWIKKTDILEEWIKSGKSANI